MVRTPPQNHRDRWHVLLKLVKENHPPMRTSMRIVACFAWLCSTQFTTWRDVWISSRASVARGLPSRRAYLARTPDVPSSSDKFSRSTARDIALLVRAIDPSR